MTEAMSSSERTLRGIGRGGSLNLMGAVCQQVCLFLTTAMIARVLGQESLGLYIVSFALLTLVSLVVMLGLKAALTRFVAVHLADSEFGAMRRLLRFALALSVGLSTIVGTSLVVFAAPVAELFRDPGLTLGIRVVGVTLPAFVLRDLSLAAVQGWRTQKAFALIGWVYEPVARLAITGVLLAIGFGLAGAFAALMVGSWTSALAALFVLLRRVRGERPEGGRVNTRRVIGFAVSSWGNTLATTGLIWADTLLLGYLANSSDVGTYTVATRLVSMAVFVMAPIDALFAPHFAHLFHRDDHSALSVMYSAATNWTLRLSLPAFVVLLVFPEGLLRIFGPGFTVGASVTVILACGQLVNAATGPCGSMLNMSGHVGLNMLNNVGALVLNIALNLALIPHYGPVGAAWAWSLSLAVVNLTKLLQVRHILHVMPFDRITVKAISSGLITLVAAVGLGELLPETVPATVLGAVLVLGVYIAVTLCLRLGEDEVKSLNGLRRSSPDARIRT